MCGHAVLAAAYVILNFYEKNKEVIEFDTLDGKITIIKNDDVYEMDFPQYQLKSIPVTEEMIDALGAVPKEAYLGRDLLLVLEDEDTVIKLCEIVTASGADYIKTSTGFGGGGATREDVALFAKHVGPNVKIKAAGGIANLQDAEDFINLGASRLGTSRIVKAVKAMEK